MSTYQEDRESTQKYKRYWIIGIVVAILVVALLGYNYYTKSATRNEVAATIGDQDYTVAEVAYFYQGKVNTMKNQAETYAQYGIDSGYDPDKSPEEQVYDESTGKTYAEYFLDQAMQEMQEMHTLVAEAEAAGYTLSEDGQAAFDSNMDALEAYSLQNGYSEDAYLKLIYGNTMSDGLFEDLLMKQILADDYAAAKQEEFTYTDAELDAYYKENAADLDSYEYRTCTIYADTEEKTDADGNVIEPTEEETAAAMSAAQEKANGVVNLVNGGTSFNEAAAQYVEEETAASYRDDADYGHSKDVLGSQLSSTYKDWMTDSARQPGDITAIAMDGTGYTVVQFLGREKGNSSYQTMSYRKVVVLAETTENEDGTVLPTEDQLAAAKTKAEELLEQFKSTGTSEAFAELAKTSSADEETKDNGGLVEEANRDSLDTAIVSWLFSTDRKIGDTTIVEYNDQDGNVAGYQILYVEAFGQLRWVYQATTALQSTDYQTWFDDVSLKYPLAEKDALSKIPALNNN